MQRVRRFVRWFRSDGSPSEYTESDIATHRWLAFGVELMGMVAVAVSVLRGGIPGVENPGVGFAIAVGVLAVTLATGAQLRVQALRWQYESDDTTHKDE